MDSIPSLTATISENVYLLLPSRNMAEILLKKSDANPENNQNNQEKSHIFLLFTYGCRCELYYVFLTTFVDVETLILMKF